MSENEQKQEPPKIEVPSLERIQQELGSAKSIDDFFGKEGIFARLFATTLEQMLEGELTAELGYEKYEAKGRNSGNNRTGKYKRKVRSSGGEVEVAVPREVFDDVPLGMEILSRSCCTSTKPAAMNWKTRLSRCRPKGCRRGTSTTVCRRCTGWMYRPRPSAR